MQDISDQSFAPKISEMNIKLPSLSEIKTFTLFEKTEESPPKFELPKIDMKFFEKSFEEKISAKSKKKIKLPSPTAPTTNSTDATSPDNEETKQTGLRRSSRIRPDKKLNYSDYINSSEEDASEEENEPEEIIEASDGTKFRVLSVDNSDFLECLHCFKVVQQKSMYAHLKSRVHKSKNN
ncbi:unnamed protein product [Blepharisma stoltei]|uniref:C2H2-type domain-containing protein n=1 Tax=Blepharisma stoltei TaxID=1481888 RepID=A0AAU9KEU1_9CILI|nr:unnamed protein product [Blepharisma stoltei]